MRLRLHMPTQSASGRLGPRLISFPLAFSTLVRMRRFCTRSRIRSHTQDGIWHAGHATRPLRMLHRSSMRRSSLALACPIGNASAIAPVHATTPHHPGRAAIGFGSATERAPWF
jgi:hypothetical protein